MSAPIQLNSTMQKLPAEEESTIPAVSTETENGPKGREQSPETTEGVSDAGQSQAGASVEQGQAGASVGQDQAGASVGQEQAGASVRQGGGGSDEQLEEDVRRLVRRHADLSFTSCFERGCRFHSAAKDMARYWPEDHERAQRRANRRTRQPRGSQLGNW